MLNEYLTLTLAQVPDPAGGAATPPPPPNQPASPLTTTAPPTGTPSTTQQTQSQPSGPSGLFMPLMLLAVLGVFFFMSWSSQRKEKKKRQELLDSITKGAKVLTSGGIIGTVADVRDNEVILKVDENSNTRIKFTRSAIQSVLDDKTVE